MVKVSGLSANQMWKRQRAAGITTLDFCSWLEREKAKAFFNETGPSAVPQNKPLNDSIQNILDQLHVEAGLKTKAGTDYILGINKKGLIITGVAVSALIVGIIVYKKMKHE